MTWDAESKHMGFVLSLLYLFVVKWNEKKIMKGMNCT